MLREVLLSMSRNQAVRDVIVAAPVTSNVVNRYVPGETVADAVRAATELDAFALCSTIDRLGEDVLDAATAATAADAYVVLLAALAELNLGAKAEVSLKLSAMGQALGSDGRALAIENARKVCQAAANAGTTVTIDMEDHTTTDSTLDIIAELRRDFPFVGAVLQAYLYRTEADCRDLATAGSRVRLCKGAYKEPQSVAFQTKKEVDLSYVRCMRALINGEGYPMFATHDPRLVDLAKFLTSEKGRAKDTFEFQMLYGIRPDEQKALAAEGFTTRVYVPYGEDWYGYFMRRLAERPANLAFFARSLISKD